MKTNVASYPSGAIAAEKMPYQTREAKSVSVNIRSARMEDAERCGIICYEAFKSVAEHHNFPPDFPSPDVAGGLYASLFARNDIYSIVAEMDGRVVGSNVLWENAAIAGIGPITIDPEAQNAAIGRRLMIDVLERVREKRFAGVRLVQAAYHNRSLSLYTKLGFDVQEPLATVQGAAIEVEIPGYDVRSAKPDDLEACNKLCMRIHGFDRGPELRAAIGQKTATVVEHLGRITGYATGIGFFGHAVGETNEDMMALISAAKTFAGPGFLLPIRNGELFRWCMKKGLRIVQPMTLMSMGLYQQPTGVFLPSILF